MNLIESISNLANILGWIIAGLWFLRGYFLRREDTSKIDLTIDAHVIAENNFNKALEIKFEVKNFGNVRHIIKNMTYSLKGASILEMNKKLLDEAELDFPVSIASGRSLFPSSWEYSFVEPESKSVYKQLILIPQEIDLIKITVRMQYLDKESDFHSASWFGKI